MKIRVYTPIYKKNNVEVELHEVDLEKGIFRYTIYKRSKYVGDYQIKVNLSDWKSGEFLDLNYKSHEEVLRGLGLEGGAVK